MADNLQKFGLGGGKYCHNSLHIRAFQLLQKVVELGQSFFPVLQLSPGPKVIRLLPQLIVFSEDL